MKHLLLAIALLVPIAGEVEPGRELAMQIVEASGGIEAWNDPRLTIAFEFVQRRGGAEAVRVAHVWRRSDNHAVVRGTLSDGRRWRVEFDDVFEKRGDATINGEPAGADASRLVQMAHARFINDTYWLLMPLKLLDPGVHHQRLPDTTIDGHSHRVLALSFDRVGLTPGDRYWLYVDASTMRVTRWKFQLESGRTGEYLWERYERFGPLTLPLVRRHVGSDVEIRFDNVSVRE